MVHMTLKFWLPFLFQLLRLPLLTRTDTESIPEYKHHHFP